MKKFMNVCLCGMMVATMLSACGGSPTISDKAKSEGKIHRVIVEEVREYAKAGPAKASISTWRDKQVCIGHKPFDKKIQTIG